MIKGYWKRVQGVLKKGSRDDGERSRDDGK
jgi:hypothetical protein